jgi:glycosyltransferase involved in cell wall biosynthesis
MSMLAIAANTFDKPSETFIRAHVTNIAPGRTVLICRQDGGATQFGCPVLSDVAPQPTPRHRAERISISLRNEWRRLTDPAASGRDEARVRSFLQRHGVTAVLAEYGPNGVLLRRACVRAGVLLYVHFHGFDATRLARKGRWRRYYRRLFRDAAGVIVPSKFLASRLLELGCPHDKLHVSPNGIDPSQLSETQRATGRVVAIGRLVEKKAPHLTIRAFSRVRRERPDATLVMIGDGGLRALCDVEIEENGLQQCVEMLGAQGPDRVKRELAAAQIFAQHSVTAQDGDMESFGISLVEAMASSVPVVTTNHNGFRETVADGETGLLVEEHDVDGMAAAMLSLLNDPERAEAMGRAGRARVEALFTRERTATRLREIMGLTC